MLRTLKAADEEKATGFMGSVNICRDNKGVIESLHCCYFWWLLSSEKSSMHSGGNSIPLLSNIASDAGAWEKVVALDAGDQSVEEIWPC